MGVFCRGARGSGFRRLCVGITLGLDFYWARVQRVSPGRYSSDGEILWANCCMSLLWLRCRSVSVLSLL